ncbi:MAG: hypothetical protein A3J97_07195, partial [Spirochaetes bacterium RIFOXYC1_FULL_54_7]
MRGVSLRAAAIAVILGAVSGTICAADGPVVSGTVNTMVHTAVGTGSFPDFHFGAEEYANLRLKAGVGERGTVHAAVNLIASSGTNSAAVVASGAAVGENYTATMELERLYVRILGDSSDTDFGLMRIAFGYGQAFRPTDILNPPNPLLPEARPRGILGIATAVYPSLDIKVQGFAAGGRDPLESDGGGMLSGASVDAHFSQGSFQALYAFQSPGDDSREGINRFGFSLKLEAGAGIVLDALYALEPGFEAGLDGLEAAVGADYSFLDGKLYALLQYLYNGPGILDPKDNLDALYAARDTGSSLPVFNRRNYLFAQTLYSYSDFTRFGLACLMALDDLSFSPALTLEHEPFQG